MEATKKGLSVNSNPKNKTNAGKGQRLSMNIISQNDSEKFYPVNDFSQGPGQSSEKITVLSGNKQYSNFHHYTPQCGSNASQIRNFGESIAPEIWAEFTEKSAIAPDVFLANVRAITDIEIDPITQEVIETPICDLMGWRYTRFGQQARKQEQAAVFTGEDGQVWQIKLFGIAGEVKRSGRYFAPKGNGDVPFLPTIPRRIVEAIAEKYKIDPPQEGEPFWPWFINHPQIPLVLTEGGKKALSAISQGEIALALYGCQCGNDGLSIKPELLPYVQGRKVTIAYDQDPKGSSGQRKVFKGTQRIARNLTFHAKATVAIAQWNGEDGKGIDDLIANDPAKFKRAMEKAITYAEFQNQAHRDLTQWGINEYRHERFLSDINAPDTAKIIGIQSAKGTNKTGTIANRIQQRQADHHRTYPLVHRVQLGLALSQRYGVDYISELSDSETNGALGLSLCIDSLMKVDPETVRGHDIVLDECEQSIWELLDSSRGNLGKNKAAILNRFQDDLIACVESRGQIILSDADLSPVTISYIAGLIGASREECYIVVNTFNPIQGKRNLFKYNSPEQLLASAINAIAIGKKIQIFTGAQQAQSKYSTTNLSSLLSKMFPDKRIGVLDSHTVSDPTNPAYGCMENLDAYLSEYDVVICSPVIETGVSIEQPHFDAVYAFGQGTQTVEQFCQGLARYRLDVDRHIWVRHRAPNNCFIGNGETSPYALINSEQKKAKHTIRILNQAENLRILDDRRPEHLKCWATMAALHNQGKKNYDDAVYDKLEEEGYNLIDADPEMVAGSDVVKDRIDLIKESNYAQEITAIAESPTPDEFTYESLKRKQAKTEPERHQERKGDLCRALATDDVTPEDVEKCDHGWLSQLALHYYFTIGREFLQARDSERLKKIAGEDGEVFSKDVNRRTNSLQISLLEKLGFERFLNGIGEFSKTSLADWFENEILPARIQIQQALGVKINPDKDSPISFVQRVLKKFGLALTYLGRFGERGNTERRYGPADIDPDGRQAIFPRWVIRDTKMYPPDTVSTESLLRDKGTAPGYQNVSA